MIYQFLVAGTSGLLIILSVYGIKLTAAYLEGRRNKTYTAVITGTLNQKILKIFSVFFGLLLIEVIVFGVVGGILLPSAKNQFVELIFGIIMILVFASNIFIIFKMTKAEK
jgi:hypothetical protein